MIFLVIQDIIKAQNITQKIAIILEGDFKKFGKISKLVFKYIFIRFILIKI